MPTPTRKNGLTVPPIGVRALDSELSLVASIPKAAKHKTLWIDL